MQMKASNELLLLTLQVRVKHCSSMAVQALQLIFDVFQ